MARQWDDATGVVTPEAVELRLQEANVGSRTAAFLVDAVIIALVLWGLNLTIGWIGERVDVAVPEWVGITVLTVANFVVLLGYPVAFELLAHGKSPGKAAMGLRVLTVEGSPVRFRHAAIRAAFWLVDFIGTLGAAAMLATLLSRRHQRLGDMVAGTIVVRERSASPAPRAADFTVPPGAESFAASLDPSGLSARDYEVLREFLLRRASLPDRKRYEIASRLAAAFGAKLHHEPPLHLSAEDFLMCLGARYHQGSNLPAADAPPPDVTPSQPPPGEWSDFAPPQ